MLQAITTSDIYQQCITVLVCAELKEIDNNSLGKQSVIMSSLARYAL